MVNKEVWFCRMPYETWPHDKARVASKIPGMCALELKVDYNESAKVASKIPGLCVLERY